MCPICESIKGESISIVTKPIRNIGIKVKIFNGLFKIKNCWTYCLTIRITNYGRESFVKDKSGCGIMYSLAI